MAASRILGTLSGCQVAPTCVKAYPVHQYARSAEAHLELEQLRVLRLVLGHGV